MLERVRLPLDHPNERSLHSSPVPRSGGFALVPAVLIAWLLIPGEPPWLIFGAAAALFAVSILDDLRGLSVRARLACHLAAAALVAVGILGVDNTLVLGIAIVAIAWMVNLYNFMDGSDGLAGGMTVIGFASYGTAAVLGADDTLAAASLAVAAGALGFLIYNFNPARVFLGDAGSIPLGLLAGGIGLEGWQGGLWPVWFPLLVFAPFVVDASVTLLQRAVRGEAVWRAHRDHYYQRLVRMGWGHRRTALAEYALMIACATAAVFALGQPIIVQASVLAASLTGCAVLMISIDRAWRRANDHARVLAIQTHPVERVGPHASPGDL
ncbi:MAG: glycosyltransferase family 4 protein [Burkholderiales bacterium]|nr:glycosyltransferase family 4 protein [Burkholderiales bacterium]